MRVYVPTRGRWRDVAAGTLRCLEPSVRMIATFVVRPDEDAAYRREIGSSGVEIVAAQYDTIDQKRLAIGQFAARRGEKKFAMLDDDLTFLVRRGEDSRRQRMATQREVMEMLQEMETQLEHYACVAVSAREANGLSDGVTGPRPAIKECYRAMRAVGYRTQDYLSVEHCRVPCMEDHDVTLQLLKSGRKNAVMYWWASGQKSTSLPGGCSAWRTREVHDAAARQLAALHPDVVRLRHKTALAGAGDLTDRLEVTIQWQRAYREKRP